MIYMHEYRKRDIQTEKVIDIHTYKHSDRKVENGKREETKQTKKGKDKYPDKEEEQRGE